MQRRSKARSPYFTLSLDYLVFALIILIVLGAVLVTIYRTITSSHQANQDKILSIESIRIANNLTDYFASTNRIMVYMGKQIAEHGPNDLNYIYNIFQKTSGSQYKEQELFSWSMFDWVAPNNLQLVNSKNGIAKNPPDMSVREYCTKSPKHPWTLQVSKPTLGNPSGKWVVPAATGVTDANGKYLGAIVVGFDIAALTKHIERTVIGSNISFLILDENMNIVAKSADNNIDPASTYFKDTMSNNNYFSETHGDIALEDNKQQVLYSKYVKINGYPYIVLVGFNKAFSNNELKSMFTPRILELLGIGIFFLGLLYIFRKRLINNVIALSQAAQKIAQGEFIRKLPRSKSSEATILAKQLVRVMRYMLKEKHQKQIIDQTKSQQQQLLRIIRESDDEKEIFLRELYQAMNSPLNTVITGAELLKNRPLGHDMDAYEECFNLIYSAGRYLESYTTDILNPATVNVAEVISRSVRMQRKKATETMLKIEVKVSENIPDIYADELRLRQILVSTLNQSIMCIQDAGNISIEASVLKKKNGKPAKLIIKIADDGIGMGETERTEIWARAFGEPDKLHQYSRNPDITSLSLPIIRHLVNLHQGQFHVDATSRLGTVFTITLPYLNKRDLSISGKHIADKQVSQAETTAKNLTPSASNVIHFPRKSDS